MFQLQILACSIIAASQSLSEMEKKNNIRFTELVRRAIKQVRNNYSYTSTICDFFSMVFIAGFFSGRHDIAEILLKVALKHQKFNQSMYS